MKKIALVVFSFLFLIGNNELSALPKINIRVIKTWNVWGLFNYREVSETHDLDNNFHRLSCEGIGNYPCKWRQTHHFYGGTEMTINNIEDNVEINVGGGTYSGTGAESGFNYEWSYDVLTDLLEIDIEEQ